MKRLRRIAPAAVLIAAVLATGSASAAAGELQCTLTFQLKSWSIIYKSATAPAPFIARMDSRCTCGSVPRVVA